ncbi:TerB N-terminal domain-containing protein [Collinsella tanakaei]|nr:TerB N-terminal domain-containing protein [Collinsella tanakaei]
MADVQRIIDQIMNDEKLRRSSHFSDRIYTSEPILTTARQMATYLPDRYREMRAISRWQQDGDGSRGRWLSEAELFYRQGVFMEDFEDDCPYHGTFKSFYPTYNAMSDRQLRGYFTWRAAVRRGSIEETSLSFAYVYLYELLCGIGVADPLDGFGKFKAFWDAYRAFAPEIDRYARVWLQDYVVYHGLDPQLVADQKNVAFDRLLIGLQAVTEIALARPQAAVRGKKSAKASGALLPVDAGFEDRMLRAVDALSTYRIGASRMYREQPEGLRHVACATYVQLVRYYDKHRKCGLIESLFGSRARLPYTMFASAVFFAKTPHPDAVVDLTPLSRFTCEGGLWTCERVHGSRSRSSKLGEAMRAVDRLMRMRKGCAHQLKDEKIPRYLEQIIEREIDAWELWERSHAPRRIDIDLTKLSGIRSAAAETREALLIDEEREDVPPAESDQAEPATEPAATREVPSAPRAPVAGPAPAQEAHDAADGSSPFPPAQAAYLRALLANDPQARAESVRETPEDLLVDAINEMAFDLIGDTVVEFGESGPTVVEDYREDLEELLA